LLSYQLIIAELPVNYSELPVNYSELPVNYSELQLIILSYHYFTG